MRNITCNIAASKSVTIPLDYIILANWVLEDFMLADKPFAKALWRLQTFVLVNNNLFRKLSPSFE